MTPFFGHRALRRIIQTFTNDESQDFDKWATNPLVAHMLTQAKDLLKSGQLSEKDVEQALLTQLQVERAAERYHPSDPACVDAMTDLPAGCRLAQSQMLLRPPLTECLCQLSSWLRR